MNIEELDKEFSLAKEELGEEEFNARLRTVFGIPCLDFVDSLVINLPEPCFANCEYCIDKYLRKHTIDNENFLSVCEKVFKEFPKLKKVAITGGTMNYTYFNKLVDMIKSYFPDIYINWNTNGIGVDENYNSSIKQINHINLHRNSIDENENAKVFKATKKVLTIDEAKSLFGEKLCLRITIDENFDIDDYVKSGIPLYLNKMLPGTKNTNEVYNNTLKKLDISPDLDVRRRNVYLSATYKDIPVRVCVGDRLSTHVPNRKPTFLNVVIIHRSGVVCGSWFEDDKLLLKPKI